MAMPSRDTFYSEQSETDSRPRIRNREQVGRHPAGFLQESMHGKRQESKGEMGVEGFVTGVKTKNAVGRGNKMERNKQGRDLIYDSSAFVAVFDDKSLAFFFSPPATFDGSPAVAPSSEVVAPAGAGSGSAAALRFVPPLLLVAVVAAAVRAGGWRGFGVEAAAAVLVVVVVVIGGGVGLAAEATEGGAVGIGEAAAPAPILTAGEAFPTPA